MPALREVTGQVTVMVVAVKAALRATFPPLTIEGKPEKFRGVLVYKFAL